jgi:glycine/D-amino acid oxidase-like deaminating enzyme
MRNNSPWLHNFKYDREIKTISGLHQTDICIVGGGIAGLSTAFMLLKHTDKKIILLEGDLVAHGATGHNAGYVEAEFEKPFREIVKEHGLNTAREGKKELDEAWGLLDYILEVLGLPGVEKTKSIKAFADLQYFKDALQEEYLKYGKVEKEIYVDSNSNWKNAIDETYLESINFVDESEIKKIIGSENKKLDKFKAAMVVPVVVGNSALLTEELAKHCLEKYKDRFEIFEKSFVSSIRLLQNGNAILDTLSGVCMSKKVILCTNGFENFDIFGPMGMQIDKEFHHEISGLIGYMMGTFTKTENSKDSGGKFYDKDFRNVKNPYDAGKYIYYTTRKFNFDVLDGELISIGGPEVKLHDRKIYRRDHEFDERIYQELEEFQKDFFNISDQPVFKWHGLMGYTKSGIRIVGQDKKFSDLYYNLGCNGIGFLPSIAGGKRIAQLFAGKKFPPSIFDPK